MSTACLRYTSLNGVQVLWQRYPMNEADFPILHEHSFAFAELPGRRIDALQSHTLVMSGEEEEKSLLALCFDGESAVFGAVADGDPRSPPSLSLPLSSSPMLMWFPRMKKCGSRAKRAGRPAT